MWWWHQSHKDLNQNQTKVFSRRWLQPNWKKYQQKKTWIIFPSIGVNIKNSHWKLLPRNLTWNLKMMVSKRNHLFQGLLFRFHVKFQGCTIKCFFLWSFAAAFRSAPGASPRRGEVSRCAPPEKNPPPRSPARPIRNGSHVAGFSQIPSDPWEEFGIFTYTWTVDFYGFHVGKYTRRPMDLMGIYPGSPTTLFQGWLTSFTSFFLVSEGLSSSKGTNMLTKWWFRTSRVYIAKIVCHILCQGFLLWKGHYSSTKLNHQRTKAKFRSQTLKVLKGSILWWVTFTPPTSNQKGPENI